jgi:hypothetical protein
VCRRQRQAKRGGLIRRSWSSLLSHELNFQELLLVACPHEPFGFWNSQMAVVPRGIARTARRRVHRKAMHGYDGGVKVHHRKAERIGCFALGLRLHEEAKCIARDLGMNRSAPWQEADLVMLQCR